MADDHVCDPSNPDCAAYLHYLDPANRHPADTAHARAVQPRQLSSHVPIRFRPEVIEQVKALAEDEGLTVSAWIRRAVEVALQRPPGTYNSAGNIAFTMKAV